MLLGELGQQAAQLLQRGASPDARLRIDAEVHPHRGDGRVGDPEGDGGLDGDVLEVESACVEHQRLLAIVDRDLAECGRQRAEPEGLAGAVVRELAPSQVAHVSGGVGSQVVHEQELGDVSHR